MNQRIKTASQDAIRTVVKPWTLMKKNSLRVKEVALTLEDTNTFLCK